MDPSCFSADEQFDGIEEFQKKVRGSMTSQEEM